MEDERTDEALAERVQEGDHDAFAILMERYAGKLLRYGERLMPREQNVGDIVQDVFIAAYENIKEFNAARRFSPWLYRIAHNAFVSAIRRQARGPLYLFNFDEVISHPVYEDPVPSEKETEELRVLLEKGLNELSPAYREIVDLHYFEGFNYREIADILHVPMGTVGIRLARARKVLKKHFPEYHE